MQYPVVGHALEHLQNQGDDKAGQFLASIMRFQLIIALVISGGFRGGVRFLTCQCARHGVTAYMQLRL
jgi:hypothetical protein